MALGGADEFKAVCCRGQGGQGQHPRPKGTCYSCGQSGHCPKICPIRTCKSGHLTTYLPPYQIENLPVQGPYPESQDTTWPSLQVERNVAASPLFLPFQAFRWNSAAHSSKKCLLEGLSFGGWPVQVQTVIGSSMKQMPQLVTQTSASCRSAMTLQMCFRMNGALHKETA